MGFASYLIFGLLFSCFVFFCFAFIFAGFYLFNVVSRIFWIKESSWIELPENPANTCAWYTETLDSYLDFFMSYQKWTPLFTPQEIEPATTERRAKTLPLRRQPISHTMPNQLFMVIAPPIYLNVSCKLNPYSLLWPCLPRRIGKTHPPISYNLKLKNIGVHFLFYVEELYCELNYHDQKISRIILQLL